jgi:hypothetical protein
MTKDIIWKTFEKTGDLNAYLLLKEVENLKLDENSEEKTSEFNKSSS